MGEEEVVQRSELQASEEWCRSVGKKVVGIHYRERNGTRHAVCPPLSDKCYVHEDQYNPHKRPITHLVKDAPEVFAVGAIALLAGPRTAKKALKFLR